jgi:hypothetical protein
LITSKIIGSARTWAYVGLVTLFATIAGLLYGAWVDGASLWLILLALAVFLGALILILWWVGKRNQEPEVSSDAPQP